MYLLNLNRKGDIYKDDNGVTGVPEFLTLIKKVHIVIIMNLKERRQ